MKSYSEKLKDPRWQKLRLEALDAAEWKCKACYEKDETLHVHHRKYIKGREPWEYSLDELIVVCKTCHKEIHDYKDKIIDEITRISPFGLKMIFGFSKGFVDFEKNEFDFSKCKNKPEGIGYSCGSNAMVSYRLSKELVNGKLK